MFPIKLKILLSYLVYVVILLSCEFDDKPSEPIVNKPFDGQSIMLIVPKVHADIITGPVVEYAKLFKQKTGGEIRIIFPGFNDTIDIIKQSLTDENLHFDVFVVLSMWSGHLFSGNYIEAIPAEIKTKIQWHDVLPIYKNNILSWNSIAYGFPLDGDSINLFYRKDIFEKKSIKNKFFKIYGYELSPPKTWQQYRQVAEFFTGWDWDGDGLKEYGNAVYRVKGDTSTLHFIAQAATYTKHPDDKAYYFDVNTMKPRINNPGFVKALEEYVQLLDYGPKAMINFVNNDLRNSFVTGEVVMAIDWGNLGTYAVNSSLSIVKNKVGYAQIPYSNTVYNSKAKQWDERINPVSSISGNWMMLVNKESKNKDLALAFCAFMTSAESTQELIADGSSGVNPSRFSHFEDEKALSKSGFSQQSARSYLDEISISLNYSNVVFDINIPGASEYYEALDLYIYQAAVKLLKPQEALDQVAIKWQEITNNLGRDKQIQYYKASLNMKAEQIN